MENKTFPCPVCATPVQDFATCPHCCFQNEGQGLDEAFPNCYRMDYPYTLNEARDSYRMGGATFTRDLIEHRHTWDRDHLKSCVLPCPVCGILVEEYNSCPVCDTPVLEMDICPICHFRNYGQGWDEARPDHPRGLHGYSLHEARAWFQEGGPDLTRKKIKDYHIAKRAETTPDNPEFLWRFLWYKHAG